MYDYELILISETYTRDENGNFNPKEALTSVLCDLKNVTRSEFYSAAQAGLKPELVVEINGFEYAGQKLVEFMGERYSVVRSYRPTFETLELTCERKAKDG